MRACVRVCVCACALPVDDSSDTDEKSHFVLHEWTVGWDLGQVEQGLQ